MKSKPIFWSVAIIAVLFLLFALPRMTNPNKALLAKLTAAGIECIGGHANLAQHFHPILNIIVDGVKETIPADVGNITGCMAELHVHDANGTLHIETVALREVRLKEFFVVWDRLIEREGYNVTMTVDGKVNSALGELILKDKQNIVLEYKSK